MTIPQRRILVCGAGLVDVPELTNDALEAALVRRHADREQTAVAGVDDRAAPLRDLGVGEPAIVLDRTQFGIDVLQVAGAQAKDAQCVADQVVAQRRDRGLDVLVDDALDTVLGHDRVAHLHCTPTGLHANATRAVSVLNLLHC